jgi:hypothetical protein
MKKTHAVLFAKELPGKKELVEGKRNITAKSV